MNYERQCQVFFIAKSWEQQALSIGEGSEGSFNELNSFWMHIKALRVSQPYEAAPLQGSHYITVHSRQLIFIEVCIIGIVYM